MFFYIAGADARGRSVSENRLLEILPGGSVGRPIRVPLKKPFTSFFTATVRAGSPPSQALELLRNTAGIGNDDQFRAYQGKLTLLHLLMQ